MKFLLTRDNFQPNRIYILRDGSNPKFHLCEQRYWKNGIPMMMFNGPTEDLIQDEGDELFAKGCDSYATSQLLIMCFPKLIPDPLKIKRIEVTLVNEGYMIKEINREII